MTSARIVGAEELARWLVSEGLAEEQDGYGHASGKSVAESLLEKYIIIERPKP